MSTAPPAALTAAATLVGPSAALDVVRPLVGGSHATTYLIRTATPRREMILRVFPSGDAAADDEERAFAAIGALDGTAPRLLARSTEDEGPPWVLISRLPGAADIVPDNPHDWATQIGYALAGIHTADTNIGADLDSVFDRRGNRARLFGPAAPIVDNAWESTIVTAPMVLTHGDYQSGNVLWNDGTLSGVIDWEGAARGPAGYDIGWCRFDLYLLYGEHLADVFLRAYEEAVGTTIRDPHLWDLWTLARSCRAVEDWVPNYRDLGRRDLTANELRRRHTAWTQDLMQRYVAP